MRAIRASAALAALLLLAACSSRPPWAEGRTVEEEAPDDAAPQDLGRLPARLLAAHNRERAETGAPPLGWDSGLAAGAAGYARELAPLGRLAHSSIASRPGQGENLWMGTRGAYQLEEMVGHWAAEKSLFRPGTFPQVSRSGNWRDVAHYTQMIWRGTARVGCTLHQGRESDILVCRYAPAGNVVGEAVP
jgi:hypothetical protein